MHIPGASQEQAKQIRNAMKRPEGTVELKLHTEGIFEPSLDRCIILEVETGGIVFKLERDHNLNLHFTHSSPGTGTRTASVDLKILVGAKTLAIYLVWSPREIRLHVGDPDRPDLTLLKGIGKTSNMQLQIGDDGVIYSLGDKGVEVMGVSVFKNGMQVLQPTAINAWNDTIKAIKILHTGQSKEGYIFEEVCTNMSIEMLVTGFETYCKRRFLELETEGVPADWDSVIREFTSDDKLEQERDAIEQRAAIRGVSPIREFVESRRINFQNYERCKRAYNKGYGIKFGDVIDNKLFKTIKDNIGFRHKIVHVSPLIGALNIDRLHLEEPIFPNKQYANDTIKIFDEFIKELHAATLKLRPKD